MAYENTVVAVPKSQQAIRELIQKHSGFGTAFVSEADPFGRNGSFEGFHAKVLIDGKPYQIRVMAKVKEPQPRWTERQKENFRTQEERRIWRVLYHHMKSVYEASDSGVMEFRELMLPYLVTAQGDTIAERILPRIDAALETNRLLGDGRE